MSGLLYICDYGNNSESDESEVDNKLPKLKRPEKLPVPNLSHIPAVPVEQYTDNPNLHNGRVRSFPHVRGNWATFVYIKYQDEGSLLNFATKLQTLLLEVKNLLNLCDDFHLSLSKTVVLNYHTIVPFTQSLKEVLCDIERFYLGFDNIEVLCNDEKTRTFIVLKADYFSVKSLNSLVKKVDAVLGEFKLEKFYEDPSFHISLLWMKGDHKEKLETLLDNANEVISAEVVKKNESVLIDKVYCKSGNKFYQYSLE
ncbi:UPF0406 protein C16orf57-like [Papilio xuthus]|uniref:U6 snRNA phosphodiesterase n=1 Tax=Papilio xuthus TaxID=66420 RepID=A0A194PVL7_PAPXU|nr:UPF0406 protein C16orf57-like [Papilio xuthus]